jgi:hypothetical protein
MRRHLVIISAFALLVGVAASGCGDKATAAEIVRAASTKSEQAKTAKMAIAVGVAGKTLNGEGSVDFPGKRVNMAMDAGSLGIPGASGTIDVTTIGTDAYIKLPPELASQAGGALGGKPYMKIDMQAMSQSQGFDLQSFQQTSDPAGQLTYLKGAADDVKEVGTETIRGEKTTHYKATVDLNKAEASMTADQKKAIDTLKTKLGVTTIPTETWIDGDGRVRKLSITMDLSKASGDAAAAAQAGPVTMTMEFFDYGSPVKIEAPPADQVTDLTSQFVGAGSGSSSP